MKVIDIIDETPDTRTIRLDSGSSFSFKPGQFVMVNADVLVNNEKKFVKRAYSISSSPFKKNFIDLTVKTYENGLVSKRLYNARKNEDLDITGPYGHFVFDENIHKNVALIGAGAGITPLASMMRYIKDKELKYVNADLIYSSKTPDDIIFKNELITNGHKNIKIHLTITRPDGFSWNGLKGRINEDMIKKLVPKIEDPYYYICGPTQMVEDTRKLLQNMNIDDNKIKLERFG